MVTTTAQSQIVVCEFAHSQRGCEFTRHLDKQTPDNLPTMQVAKVLTSQTIITRDESMDWTTTNVVTVHITNAEVHFTQNHQMPDPE